MQSVACLCGASGPGPPRLMVWQGWDRARHRGTASLGAFHDAMKEVVWLQAIGRRLHLRTGSPWGMSVYDVRSPSCDIDL
jgi:hypothetical protein